MYGRTFPELLLLAILSCFLLNGKTACYSVDTNCLKSVTLYFSLLSLLSISSKDSFFQYGKMANYIFPYFPIITNHNHIQMASVLWLRIYVTSSPNSQASFPMLSIIVTMFGFKLLIYLQLAWKNTYQMSQFLSWTINLLIQGCKYLYSSLLPYA